jgi:YegS/Rv2252/BmrU family lipid kinase
VERELAARQIQYRVVRTESLEHGIAEARRGAADGEIPVVMSGDGLVGQVGGALAESGTPMGILPGGRGNDLGRVLRIPSEPIGAVAILAAGNMREIDVGVVNDRRFLCIASLGFDSEANRIANQARFVKGNLVYAYAALRTLAAWKPHRFSVVVDGQRTDCFGYSVAVANSRAYGGGMFVAPEAQLDDGLLDVVLTAQVGKLRFLRSLPQVFKGTQVDNEEITMLRGAEVEVSADEDFAIYADGEHLADLPAKLHVLPRALKVIAPPGPFAGPPS